MDHFKEYPNSIKQISDSYLDDDTKDITIICDDTSIKVHKFLLNTVSPVFKTMFKGDYKENTEVVISDIEPDIVKKLIDGVYMKEIELTNVEEAAKLYNAAEKYDVSDVRNIALDYMRRKCHYTNCCFLLEQALLFDLPELVGDCKDTFEKHPYAAMEHCLQSETIGEIKDDVMAQFFEINDLSLAHEFDLYQTLEILVEKKIMKEYKKTLSKIRIKSFTIVEVLTLKLLSDSDKCAVIANIEANKAAEESFIAMPEYLSSISRARIIDSRGKLNPGRISFLVEAALSSTDFEIFCKRLRFLVKKPDYDHCIFNLSERLKLNVENQNKLSEKECKRYETVLTIVKKLK